MDHMEELENFKVEIRANRKYLYRFGKGLILLKGIFMVFVMLLIRNIRGTGLKKFWIFIDYYLVYSTGIDKKSLNMLLLVLVVIL